MTLGLHNCCYKQTCNSFTPLALLLNRKGKFHAHVTFLIITCTISSSNVDVIILTLQGPCPIFNFWFFFPPRPIIFWITHEKSSLCKLHHWTRCSTTLITSSQKLKTIYFMDSKDIMLDQESWPTLILFHKGVYSALWALKG
jgi:hypothetical protein